MLSQEKIDKAIIDCYIELYKHSTPTLDFKKAFQERSLKDAFYLNYEIDEDKALEIINKIIKQYKIKGYQIQQFKTTIHLGCSPKFKKE